MSCSRTHFYAIFHEFHDGQLKHQIHLFYSCTLLIGPVVEEEMSFKDISYLELWWPLYLDEQTLLHNFDRSHHDNNSVKLF